LNVVVLAIPPLRERLEDLPDLAAVFLQKHSGGKALTLNPSALDALTNYPWPGNVRELENALISAIALRSGDVIGVESLPPHLRKVRGSMPIPLPELATDEQLPLVEAKRRVSNAFERDYLQQIMQRAQGSVAEAERILAPLGKLLPPKDGKKVLVEVENGAADIPRVVRALDEAGIAVEALELVRPTLDDVFVEKTGYHLEDESEENAEKAPVEV